MSKLKKNINEKIIINVKIIKKHAGFKRFRFLQMSKKHCD